MERYLKKGDTLKLPGRNGIFKIEKIIGRGASSVVYSTIYENEAGVCTEHILKEYNPKYLELDRDENGVLFCVEEENKKYYDRGLARFELGYNRQLELRAIPELKNVTSNIQDIYIANGTRYIDMTCNEGKNYDDLPEKSLYDLLRRVRGLTQIIGSYHKEQLLHLDIKPNNIFTIPETPEMVILFDFDSVLKKEELIKEDSLLSYTKGWCAPEHELGKRDKICEASDLFSIGEILFAKLMDRHSEPEERNSFSDYDCIEGAELLKGAHPELKSMLKELFRRLLCNMIPVRYQSAEEVLPVLDNLIELANPAKKYLKENLPSASKNFFGREMELEKIHTMLRENKVLILSGINGNGKTELAKQYAYRYGEEYDVRVFASCTNDIAGTIISDVEVPVANLEPYSNYMVTEKEYYEYKLGELKKLVNDRVLLIVDNLDCKDEKIADLAKLDCKLLITSQNDYSDTSFRQLEISGLEEKEAREALFKSYYKKPLTAEDGQLMEEIFEKMHNHTKLIELSAKLMKAGRLSAKTLRKQFSGGVRKMSQEKISDGTTGKKAGIYQQLQQLFDCSGLSREEQYVLATLSLLPHTGVPAELFHDWCRLRGYEEINTLADIGWITWDTETDYIALHPVVAEVAVDLVLKQPEQCKDMLDRLIAFTKINPDNRAGQLHLTDSLENIRSLLEQECGSEMTEQLAKCYEALGGIFYGRKDGGLVRAYCYQALRLFEKLSKEENADLANCCQTLGKVYRLIDHKEALKYFERAVSIYERTLDAENEKTGECYVDLAELHARMDNSQEVKAYLHKAEEMLKNFSGKKSVSIGKINNYLGIWYTSTDPELAKKYFQEAETIFIRCCGEKSVTTAETFFYLGELYCKQQQYKEAEKYYLAACEIRESVLGEQHKDTGTGYNTLGKFYRDCMQEPEKGEIYLEKARTNFSSYVQNV